VTQQKHDNLTGIALMIVAMMLFPLMDAVAKWLVIADISSIQIIAVRSWMMIPVILLALSLRGDISRLKTRQPLLHAARGLFGFLAPFAFFTALKQLPLADATVVFFSSVFILTALSALLLKEHVGIHRWSAVVLGFIGVVIAMDPQGDGELSAYLLVLCASTMYSFIFLSGKYLSKKDSAISLVFSLILMMGVVSSALLPWVWVTMPWPIIGMIALMTVIAFGAHIAFASAFSRAQVSLLAPFEYTSLIWAALIGYLVWADIPSLRMWTGAATIIVCGLYVIHRESLHK
jgi:drug/metabolite transporter (DMT)-like permease